MIQLTFTGIGAAFCPAFGNTSAYIRRDKELILLDCGGMAFGALHAAGVLEEIERLICIVSHRHPDHTGSLGTLVSYAKHVAHFSITLVHPDGALGDLLRLSGIGDKDYTLIVADEWTDSDVAVRFYPIAHTSTIPAWCFTLTVDGETIYYSGDGECAPEEVWQAFLKGRIARIYQDCGRTPHKGHGNLDALLAKTPEALRSCVYPIHWDCDFREEIMAAGFGLAF